MSRLIYDERKIRFDEAGSCVEEGKERHEPKLPVGYVIGQIEKDSRIAAGGIQMEMPDELFGGEMKVLVDVRQ